MAFSAKNKLGFVDSTIVAYDRDADPNAFRIWMHNNNIVASLLLNSVVKEIGANVFYSANAEALWKNLKIWFGQQNGPHTFQLRK